MVGKKIGRSIEFCIAVAVISALFIVPMVDAASSGTIYFPETQVSSADNILHLGDTATVTITFENSASAQVTDVGSTIQYITLSAANVNPSRTLIDLQALWDIYAPSAVTPRVTGATIASLDTSAIYSPYSTTQTVYLYTWALGKPGGPSNLDNYTDSGQFSNDLLVLRPGELLNLTFTITCQNIVGDDNIEFFFTATEFQPINVPVPDLDLIPASQRMNIAFSKLSGPVQTKYWWPLHNSYDPYDVDIDTGHHFEQLSWTRVDTTSAFAKGKKIVHQKPTETPQEFSFHICGLKFDDTNMNGVYDGIEQVVNGVPITLLGADQTTNAEIYYAGQFDLVPPDDINPTFTGENELAGSYCFNLLHVTPGDYTFYIKEDVPLGNVATTPILIGPIYLSASEQGPRESIHNNFGNAKPQAKPVGGYWIPIGRSSLLVPVAVWIALSATIVIPFVYFRRMKKN